jgi:hypothetical protein
LPSLLPFPYDIIPTITLISSLDRISIYINKQEPPPSQKRRAKSGYFRETGKTTGFGPPKAKPVNCKSKNNRDQRAARAPSRASRTPVLLCTGLTIIILHSAGKAKFLVTCSSPAPAHSTPYVAGTDYPHRGGRKGRRNNAFRSIKERIRIWTKK